MLRVLGIQGKIHLYVRWTGQRLCEKGTDGNRQKRMETMERAVERKNKEWGDALVWVENNKQSRI